MTTVQVNSVLVIDKDRNVFLFFAGIIIYLIGLILTYIISNVYGQLVQSIALVPFLFYGSKLITADIETYFKYMLIFFMVSNAVIIFRMDSLNYVKIKGYLFSDFRFWPYLIPLTALFINTSFFFERLFKCIYWLGAFFLVSVVFIWEYYKNIPVTELYIVGFSAGCGFILLTWKYHSWKKKAVAASAIILALYISTVLARRNVMLTNINFLIFGFLFYFFLIKSDPVKKLLNLFAVIVLICAGTFLFLQNKNTDFKLIVNRVSEDTRENVFYLYFADMKNYMWFGKGIDGTYFCPMVTEDINIDPVEYRDLIECGYLQIILKGGIVNLILFLAIMFPAMVLGVFYSRNIFSKGCGILIFLWLIDMFPYGLPSFSLRYILVWICVGVCFNKEIRQFDESEIKEFLSVPLRMNTVN